MSRFVIPAVPERVYDSLVFLGITRLTMPRGSAGGDFVTRWALATAAGEVCPETEFTLNVDDLAAELAADPGYRYLVAAIDGALRPFAEVKAAAQFPGPATDLVPVVPVAVDASRKVRPAD